MLHRCRARAGMLMMMCSAKQVVLLTQAPTLAAPSIATLSHPANVCPSQDPNRSFVTMTTNNDPREVEAIFQRKRSLRSKLRKELQNMDPIRRSEEDIAIQSIVLGAPWFQASKILCAYISCAALREVDTSRIISEVLSKPVEVMEVGDPLDLFILPGLVFDKSGRRLGRGGGYYDLFLAKYQELAKKKKWKQPLHVALSYSLQIVKEGDIAVTSNDVPVDALVSPAGYIPISQVASDR
ncbi:5-formyltetrahydrofolate cyclo-ligase, mitochondrial-like isoform X3 [Carya illinoinensis]|uniref:5-formyltetrahydrofolate cyclo-ligase, mitochondrial-like isoform X3 n=1 Tax=Carya illinoinensis TaxID=32201 RepID=UPI001C71D6A9|nr:5-formyltetrahydrofolate cyclo-ligase, mitochondrial-like isoform X3 [Carya illinoinensis]